MDPLIQAAYGFAATCLGHGVAVDGGTLLLSIFLLGLIGGTTHCTLMCGPLVLAQVTERAAAVPAARMSELRRLAGGALVPYHLGRMTTYAGLGAVAALIAGGVTRAGLGWLPALLLAIAALLFLAYGLRRFGIGLPGLEGGGGGALGRWLARWTRPLFASPVGWRGYLLGVLLGFLPCGMLYGAIALAASTAHPAGGATAMMAFALGTVPSLLAVGVLGQYAVGRWREATGHIAPYVLLLNAGLLGFMAWRLAG